MQQFINCSNCGASNAFGQKYCGVCGAALSSGCYNCGAEVDPGSRFCGNCGATLPVETQQPGAWEQPSAGVQQPGAWGQPPGGVQQPGAWGQPSGGVQQQGAWGQPPGGVQQPGAWGQPPGGMQQPGAWGQPPGAWEQPTRGWEEPRGGPGPSSSSATILVIALVVLLIGLGVFGYFAFFSESPPWAGLTTTSSLTVEVTKGPFVTGTADNTTNKASMTVTWETDKAVKGMVEYGKNDSYGSKSDWEENYVKSHSVDLENLDAGTSYYYKIILVDKKGNELEKKGTPFKTPQ